MKDPLEVLGEVYAAVEVMEGHGVSGELHLPSGDIVKLDGRPGFETETPANYVDFTDQELQSFAEPAKLSDWPYDVPRRVYFRDPEAGEDDPVNRALRKLAPSVGRIYMLLGHRAPLIGKMPNPFGEGSVGGYVGDMLVSGRPPATAEDVRSEMKDMVNYYARSFASHNTGRGPQF